MAIGLETPTADMEPRLLRLCWRSRNGKVCSGMGRPARGSWRLWSLLKGQDLEMPVAVLESKLIWIVRLPLSSMLQER